jgi:hypothetical protein
MALSTLLKGTSTTIRGPPALGSNAAAACCKAAPATELHGDAGGHAADLIPAGNFRSGGGIPSNSLLPLLQILAMHGVTDVGVDLSSTLHALCTATSEELACKSVLECDSALCPRLCQHLSD